MRINIKSPDKVNLKIEDENVNVSFPNVLRLPIIYDKNYVFTQNVASNEWIINHNLNKFPSVIVMDSSGNEVEGEVVHLDENNLKIYFENEFSGKASLN